MADFLEELQKLEGISYEEFEDQKHYIVERVLELLVIYASDLLLSIFSHRQEDIPTTLRTTFIRAGELHVLPEDLAQRLAEAAAMRNLLVHVYAKVDLQKVYESISPALENFSRFVEIMSEKMGLLQPDPVDQPAEGASSGK